MSQTNRANLASVEKEIEARFLVPKTSFSKSGYSGKIIRIRQFYISPEKRPAAIKRLLLSLPKVANLLKLELKTFRLREQRIRGSDKIFYFAQLKTKRQSLSRREVSIPISSKLFKALLDFADEGYVAKDRMVKAAYLSSEGKRFRIEAHIDQILALGLGKNRLEKNRLPGFLERYAIVEIELPDEKSYKVLKKESWGSFSFIETGFNLQDLRSKSGAKISFRSLSRGRPAKKKIQKVVERLELQIKKRKTSQFIANI